MADVFLMSVVNLSAVRLSLSRNTTCTSLSDELARHVLTTLHSQSFSRII